MLSYLTIGANDVALSEDFAHYSLPDMVDPDNGPGTIFVMKPFDGGVATPGNGMMPAFRLPDTAAVHAVHAAGVAAGGANEGDPGTRDRYTATFYIGYLRDPVGNKVALFTVLSSG